MTFGFCLDSCLTVSHHLSYYFPITSSICNEAENRGHLALITGIVTYSSPASWKDPLAPGLHGCHWLVSLGLQDISKVLWGSRKMNLCTALASAGWRAALLLSLSVLSTQALMAWVLLVTCDLQSCLLVHLCDKRVDLLSWQLFFMRRVFAYQICSITCKN